MHWVLPDPTRERSVDPLGTGAVAERIAARLVPGFSSQTSRARYLSLLCAAVRRAEGSGRALAMIHGVEAELAVDEAIHHREEGVDACPGIIGRQRARAELAKLDWQRPSRPERLYKSTAFAIYRPLLRSLGLLSRSRVPTLTSSGEVLARAYPPLNASKERRCLSAITNLERSLLYGPLGLDGRASHAPESVLALRCATYAHLRLTGADAAETVLKRHARISRRESSVGRLLHTAYAWETVSVGLLLGFKLLASERCVSSVAHALTGALARRPAIISFDRAVESSEFANETVALLRESMRLKNSLPAGCEQHLGIARLLLEDRKPSAFLRQLMDRHRQAKGGDAWLRLNGDRVEVLATGKNLDFRPRPRSYRLDAYMQFLRDIKKL